MIIASPARTLGEVVLNYTINDFDRIEHNRIVRIANTEADEVIKLDVQRGSIPGAPNATLVIRRVEAIIAEA